MKTQSLVIPFAAVASLLASFLVLPAVQAQVTVTPLSTPVALQQGQTYQFTYTVADTSTGAVYFSGDTPAFTLAPAGAATEAPTAAPGALTDQTYVGLDDSPFLSDPANPASLSGGASSSFHFFDILVGSSATLGQYSGTFELLGGTTPSSTGSFDPAALVPFSFSVVTQSSPVPEASTTLSLGLLLALGGLVLAVKRRTVSVS